MVAGLLVVRRRLLKRELGHSEGQSAIGFPFSLIRDCDTGDSQMASFNYFLSLKPLALGS
jgi:hypothetical protein